jgi:hypothetical protein
MNFTNCVSKLLQLQDCLITLASTLNYVGQFEHSHSVPLRIVNTLDNLTLIYKLKGVTDKLDRLSYTKVLVSMKNPSQNLGLNPFLVIQKAL